MYLPVTFMSGVERLGRTLSETVAVGEEGDGGVAFHSEISDKEKSQQNKQIFQPLICNMNMNNYNLKSFVN